MEFFSPFSTSLRHRLVYSQLRGVYNPTIEAIAQQLFHMVKDWCTYLQSIYCITGRVLVFHIANRVLLVCHTGVC